MPIAMHPSATIDVKLEIDESIKDAPTFRLRFLTCADVLKVEALLEEARQAKNQTAASAKLSEVLSVGLIGWSDSLGPFELHRLDSILTPTEKWELAYKVLSEPQLAEADRKKSESRSPSSTAAAGASGAAGAA